MTAHAVPDISIRPHPSFEDVVLRLSMARGEDEIMAAVREGVRPLLGADGVTFVIRDNGQCYYAEEDAISPLWKGQRFPLDRCVSGWAMLHRETVIIKDIYEDDRIPHAAYKPTFVRSLVMVPVRGDDPVAAIGAYWAKRRTPTHFEISTLQRIANVAAVALTNVMLFSSLLAAKDEATRAKDAIVLAMASLAETRDNETGNHIRRTQHYVRALSEACRPKQLYPELDDSMIELLFRSAPLHDIGKVGVPDSVLLKPGKLDDAEFSIMRTHAELGARAIADASRHLGSSATFLRVAEEMARTHHEKWDGTGYPRGLKGKEIPLSGRVMAVADVYDALVSARVYKPAFPHSEAVDIIVSERGRHFDPDLIDVFAEISHVFDEIHHRFADSLGAEAEERPGPS